MTFHQILLHNFPNYPLSELFFLIVSYFIHSEHMVSPFLVLSNVMEFFFSSLLRKIQNVLTYSTIGRLTISPFLHLTGIDFHTRVLGGVVDTSR